MIDATILGKLIAVLKDYQTYGAKKYPVEDLIDYFERKALEK